MMQTTNPNPFTTIKAREVFYVFFLTNFIGGSVLIGLSRLTGIGAKDPLWTSIGYGLTIGPWAGWFLWRLRSIETDLPSFFGKLPKRMRWGRMFGLTIATLLMSIGTFLLLASLWYSISPDSVRYLLDRMARLKTAMRATDSVLPDLSRVLLFILTIVVAPMCEELVFRGILLQRWATKWNPPIALILTSLLFGALHVNIVGIGLLGLVAGLLYYQTKSLWAPIALHAINNTVASLSLLPTGKAIESGSPEALEQAIAQGWITGLFCIVVSLPWLLRFLIKNWPRKDAPTPYQANQIKAQRHEIA
jgi:uncharacterized protein